MPTKQTKSEDVPKCCICDGDIDEIAGWKKGHSAWPVKEGRCCSKCEVNRVLPARVIRGYVSGDVI